MRSAGRRRRAETMPPGCWARRGGNGETPLLPRYQPPASPGTARTRVESSLGGGVGAWLREQSTPLSAPHYLNKDAAPVLKAPGTHRCFRDRRLAYIIVVVIIIIISNGKWKGRWRGHARSLCITGALRIKGKIKEKSDGRHGGSSRLLSLSLSIYFPLCC